MDVIDTTIVPHEGRIYRFSKDEVKQTILLERGKSLEDPSFQPITSPSLRKAAWCGSPHMLRSSRGTQMMPNVRSLSGGERI